MRAIPVFAVGAALLLTATGDPASAAEKLRVLVVTGGHGFEREPFFEVFDSFPDIEWREVQHPAANAMYAPDQRGTYDVVALYDMTQDITDEQKAWLVETLKEGKGLLVLHHAIASYQGWPEYAKIIGARYFLSPQEIEGKTWPRSTFRDDVTYTVEIADPEHPIAKGLQDFTIKDEAYGGFWVSPEVHPLLKVHHQDCGEIVGWTKEYGKTRVAYLMNGHGASAYRDQNYRTLVHRALLWVGKLNDEVGTMNDE